MWKHEYDLNYWKAELPCWFSLVRIQSVQENLSIQYILVELNLINQQVIAKWKDIIVF